MGERITGASPKAVVEQVKNNYAGFEGIIDEYVHPDPGTQDYYLDEEGLKLAIQNSVNAARFRLNCEADPTKDCRLLLDVKENQERVKDYREKYDKHMKELKSAGEELGALLKDDPMTKLIATAVGGMAAGLFIGWTTQFLLHGPAMDLMASLAKKYQALQELYMRNQINANVNQDKEWARKRPQLEACGFNVANYTPELAGKMALAVVGALAAITGLMTMLGTAIYQATQSASEASPHPASGHPLPQEERGGVEVFPSPPGGGRGIKGEGVPTLEVDVVADELDILLGQWIARLGEIEEKKTLSSAVQTAVDKIQRRLDSGDYDAARGIYENEFLPLQSENFSDAQLLATYSSLHTQLEDIFHLSSLSLWFRQKPELSNMALAGAGVGVGAMLMLSQGEIIMDFTLQAYRALKFRGRLGVWDTVHELDGAADRYLKDAEEKSTQGNDCSEEGLPVRDYLPQTVSQPARETPPPPVSLTDAWDSQARLNSIVVEALKAPDTRTGAQYIFDWLSEVRSFLSEQIGVENFWEFWGSAYGVSQGMIDATDDLPQIKNIMYRVSDLTIDYIRTGNVETLVEAVNGMVETIDTIHHEMSWEIGEDISRSKYRLAAGGVVLAAGGVAIATVGGGAAAAGAASGTTYTTATGVPLTVTSGGGATALTSGATTLGSGTATGLKVAAGTLLTVGATSAWVDYETCEEDEEFE